MARARTIWEEGVEPGRLVIAFSVAMTLTIVLVDLVIHGEITWLFDVVFMVLCLVAALRVRPQDSFQLCFLPPLLMLGTFLLLAIASPATIADPDDGTIQAVITGLTHHAGALISGYALCLAVLAMRHHVRTKRRPVR